MASIFLEAYNFATAYTMLDVDDAEKAKKFANAYAKKCTQPGRLNQKFYDAAYAVAYDPDKLNFPEEIECKRFVADFALSCHSASLLTDQAFQEMYEFAYDVSMMNLDDVEARNFIYKFLLNYGWEKYLTKNNWEYVYNKARDTIGPTEAEEFTRQFFLEFQPL